MTANKRWTRALSGFLVFVMAAGLLPTITPNAKAAETTDAFGLQYQEGWENDQEEQLAKEKSPFGAPGRSVPLFVRSELFLGYRNNETTSLMSYDFNGADGKNPQLNTLDGAAVGQADGSGTLTSSISRNWDLIHMASAPMNFNNSATENCVAVLGFSGDGQGGVQLNIRVLNRYGTMMRDGYVMQNDGFQYLWNGVDTYEEAGFTSVTAGDFNGDGKDTIVFYAPVSSDTDIGAPTLYEYDPYNGTAAPIVHVMKEICPNIGIQPTNKYNIPAVQLEAADSDGDGVDELIVTAGMNDAQGGETGYQANWTLGTQLLVYDHDKEWKQTAHLYLNTDTQRDPTEAASAARKSRLAWSTSTVGNVIAQEGEYDPPEIFTAGFVDESDHSRNIDCSSVNFGWTIVRYNYNDKKYELVDKGTAEANGFTASGYSPGDDVCHLLQAKAFRDKGAQQPAAVFISGSVYTYDGTGTSERLEKEYTREYFDKIQYEWDRIDEVWGYSLTNMQVQSVAAGNFDGNDEGREQVIFGTALRRTGKNQTFSSLYYYGCDKGNNWSSGKTQGYFLPNVLKGSFTLCPFNYDNDSTIVKQKMVEKVWSEPQVMAVLEGTPHFAEIEEGNIGNGETVFSTSTATGESHQDSHTLSTNLMFGFERTDPITGSGGGFEVAMDNNMTWSSATETTVTYEVAYSNDTDQNMVVVFRRPSYIYTYQDVHTGEKIYLSKSYQPVTSMISVAKYNAAAAAKEGMTQIDESKLCDPGNPYSYQSTAAQIQQQDKAYTKLVTAGDWFGYNGGGSMSQTLSYDQTKTEEFTYDYSVNVNAYVVAFGAKAGGGAGYGYANEKTTMNGQGIEKTGKVNGITEPGYDFNWKFAHWMMDLNGSKVPVLGYLVQNVMAPPTPPENLAVTDIKSDSLTLQWDTGGRPAESYHIYRETGISSLPYIEAGTVDGSTQQFTIEGLEPDTSYTYIIRAYKAPAAAGAGDGYSVPSQSVTATTQPAGTDSLIDFSAPQDVQAHAGAWVTLQMEYMTSGEVPGQYSVTSHWERRLPGENWKTISTAAAYGGYVRAEEDGAQYRRVVVLISLSGGSLTYYSRPITLHVGPDQTKLEDFAVANAAGGAGTLDDPYTGKANWQYAIDDDVTTKVPLVIDHNGTEIAVTEVGEWKGDQLVSAQSGTYVGVWTKDNETHYVLLTKTGDSYTVGETLTPAYLYVADGQAAKMPDGFTGNPLYNTVGAGETKAFYYRLAAVTDGSLTSYYEAANGEIYQLGEDTKYTKVENVPEKLYEVYAADGTGQPTVLGDEQGYYLWAENKLSNPISREPRLAKQGDEKFSPISPAMLLTVMMEGTTTATAYESREGTKITISSKVINKNTTNPLEGQRGSIVITHLPSGAVQSLAVTSLSNPNKGTITADWTAQAPGLYAIYVMLDGNESYGSSTSNTVYYEAADTDPRGQAMTEYRLMLQSGSAATLTRSIPYGGAVTPLLQSRMVTAESAGVWQNANSNDFTCKVIAPDTDQAETVALGSSYKPQRAGAFSFQVTKNGGTAATASAVLQVEPGALHLEPTWKDGTEPDSSDKVGLAVTDAHGTPLDSVILPAGISSLSDLLIIQCELFDHPDKTGAFPVTLSWKSDQAAGVKALQDAYQVTLADKTFYRYAGTAPVYYQAGEGGALSVASGAQGTMKVQPGSAVRAAERLQFMAYPNDNYHVASWKVNGQPVTPDSKAYRIVSMTGSTRQMLIIDSFNLDRDTAKNESTGSTGNTLLVEVTFSNKISTISYSVDSGSVSYGSLAAKTGGANIPSGAAVVAGADITFTAAPQDGYAVDKWTVTSGDGTPAAYCWPDTDKLYREPTLTLTGLTESSYTVTVYFAQKQTYTLHAALVDIDGAPTTGGTLTVKQGDGTAVPLRNGEAEGLTWGQGLTFQVADINPNLTTVQRWEYRTGSEGSWITVPGSAGKTSYTWYAPDTPAKLVEVRAVLGATQSYRLDYAVQLEGGAPAPEEAKAVLTAKSGDSLLRSGGSYVLGTAADFTLALDDAYFVTAWSDNVTAEPGAKSAALAALTSDTAVTVTIAKKPVVTLVQSTGGMAEVTGTVNGRADTPVESGGYVDMHSFVTVTLRPDVYKLADDTEAHYLDGTGQTTDDMVYTIPDVTEDITISPTWADLDSVTVSCEVVNPGTGENGTLTAAVTRKGMDAYAFDSFSGGAVYHGSTVTFTATPDAGYRVKEWLINKTPRLNDNGKSNISRTLTLENITEVQEISVQFMEIGTETMVSAGANGQIDSVMAGETDLTDSIPEGFALNNGAQITITAAPDAGYEVAAWTVNGDIVQQGGDSFTYTAVSDTVGADIEVSFHQTAYPVTITQPAHGTVTADRESLGEVAGGTKVTFTVSPAPDYTVAGWTVNGQTTPSRDESWQTVINGPTEVTAVLAPNVSYVSFEAGEGGSIAAGADGDRTGRIAVPYGESVTFTATANEFWQVSQWAVDGSVVTEGVSADRKTLTLQNVAGSHHVAVKFAATRLSVKYAAVGENGTLTATADDKPLALSAGQSLFVPGNTRLVFTAAPAPGYMVKAWTVNGETQQTLSHELVIEKLTRSVNVAVSFEPYAGFDIPADGTGYTITNVLRTPADTAPDTQIRRGGTLRFTVRPNGAESYSIISRLQFNGYDLTGGGSQGGITATRTGDGYEVTIAGVSGEIETDILAHKLVIGGLTVPASLAGNEKLNTVEKIQSALQAKLTGAADGQVFYDIALQYKDESGVWQDVTPESFPEAGLTIRLNYPVGTDSRDTFTVLHMLRDGTIETVPNVAREPAGLAFHVDSLSPFAIGWTRYQEPSGGDHGGGGSGSGGGDAGGDSITPPPPVPDTEWVNPFADVKPDDWFYSAVRYVHQNGLFSGTGKTTFSPNTTMTRVMLVTVLHRGAGAPAPKGKNPFTDVADGKWYTNAVVWAAENGIVGGYGDGRFGPDDLVTREQLAAILYRYADSPKTEGSLAAFTDGGETSPFAMTAMRWAVEQGILSGKGGGVLDPKGQTTRAEAAAMLMRYFTKNK